MNVPKRDHDFLPSQCFLCFIASLTVNVCTNIEAFISQICFVLNMFYSSSKNIFSFFYSSHYYCSKYFMYLGLCISILNLHKNIKLSYVYLLCLITWNDYEACIKILFLKLKLGRCCFPQG